MLSVDPKWGETSESLLRRAIKASHPRVRERFMALHMIASGQAGTKAAQQLERNRNTIAGWVHLFNERGPAGLIPNFRGHPGKVLAESELSHLKEVIRKPPRQAGLKTGRWSGKRTAAYIQRVFKKEVSARTALRYLKGLGFRKKLPRKHFKKADPEDQQAFVQTLTTLERKRSSHSQTAWETKVKSGVILS